MTTSDRSAYWALPAADARHLASFELAATLAEVLPVAFFLEVPELQGHYDTLWLNLVADRGLIPNGPHVKIIRQGRVWIHGDGTSTSSAPPVDALAPVSRGGDPHEQAARVADALGHVGAPKPGVARHALRFMHEVLDYAVQRDARVPWRWRPASAHGWDSDALHAVYAQVPALRRAAAGVDPLEQRFWVLLCGSSAALALDVSADAPAVLVTGTVLSGLGKASRTQALKSVRTVLPKYRATLPATIGGVELPTLPTARKAYAPIARELAAEVAGGSVSSFGVPSRLTSYASWFTAGPGHLIVVMGPHEDPRDAVTLLAYALAWQSQQTLHLVLPPGFADLVLRLLPWIRTPVRVHLSAPEGIRTLTVPARDEVLTAARSLPARAIGEHQLGNRAGWLDRLLSTVLPLGLSTAHRPTYQSWMHSGRSVLRVSRTRTGALAVRAGINYTKPGPGKPPPSTVTLTGPLSDAHLALLVPAVSGAVAAREDRVDDDDREHQLQAALAAHKLPGIGALFFHREYPAWRSRRRPGFIDFLAATSGGDLDVIETKIGGDCAVALQALEYWIWACANTTAVRGRGGWPATPAGSKHRMTLVLAKDAQGRAYDRYLYGVLEAIAGDVPWRVLIAELPPSAAAAVTGDGSAGSPSAGAVPSPPTVSRLASSQAPQALLAGTLGEPPCAPPRWIAVTTSALSTGTAPTAATTA